jgi:uridine kinase
MVVHADGSSIPLIDFDEAVVIAKQSRARLIAIDGLPVSGKSTLSDRIESELGAQSIALDDFVRPESQWASRDPGFPFGYIRYDEFLSAVRTVARGDTCRFRPYDWKTGELSDEFREVSPNAAVVVEGVSALHPDLAPLYDLRFWVESDAATTMDASVARGMGAWEKEWREIFMPSTALYLKTNPQQRADFRVAGRGARR